VKERDLVQVTKWLVDHYILVVFIMYKITIMRPSSTH